MNCNLGELSMCLSIAVDHPDHVLSSGEHEGFEFVTVHNGMGFRCGYVRVPLGHPWHGRSYDEIEPYPQVHGGLTFSKADKPCGGDRPDNGWWLGFDCAHGGDLPDPALPTDCDIGMPSFGRGVVRTQEYVEAGCRSLCQQAKESVT